MVRPGVTMRNPRLKRRLPGRRTALTVCQAMTIAITVVLPAPVASFRASRDSPGLAPALAASRWSRNVLSRRPRRGATSVSQIRVSTASIWQKKGRMPPKRWWRQWRSRRAVSGVTCQSPGFGSARHRSTWPRSSLMMGVGSYPWAFVATPVRSPNSSASWAPGALRFLAFGMGVTNSARRRRSMSRWVGCPSASSSQWRVGYSYGELMIGCLKKLSGMGGSAPAFPLPAGLGPGVRGSGSGFRMLDSGSPGVRIPSVQIPESRSRLPAYRTRTARAPDPVFVVIVAGATDALPSAQILSG